MKHPRDRRRVRKILGKSTGIYQEVTYQPRSGSPNDQVEFLKWMAEGHRSEYILTHMHADAKRIVKHFESAKMREQAARLKKTGKFELGVRYNKHNLPESAPPIAHDAAAVLDGVRTVRENLTNGNIESAVVNAVTLGRDYERMIVRQFEPLALKARRQLSNLADFRKRQTADSKAKKAAVCEQASELWRNNSAKSLTWVQQQLATQGVASLRAIKTYTKGLKRPPVAE